MMDLQLYGVHDSDLEFIRSKVLSGDWVSVRGAIDAVNDTIEYVPASDKTFFLHSASIVMTENPGAGGTSNGSSSSDSQIVAALKIDSVIKDKAKVGIATNAVASAVNRAGSGSGFGTDAKGAFNVLGLSLVGDGAKKVEIENILGSGAADAILMGWVEDT